MNPQSLGIPATVLLDFSDPPASPPPD